MKSLSDLKTHFIHTHKPEDKSRSVTHVKQSRESKEEYDDEKTYLYTHLLNDLKKNEVKRCSGKFKQKIVFKFAQQILLEFAPEI